MEKELTIVELKNDINKKLGDAETFKALMTTTFKGLEPAVAKRAVLEGVLRGFTLKDFLERNVYAIPFRDGYSLVTSIDRARKIGMRSGVVGKSKPEFEMDGKSVISCTVTVKKKVEDYIGDFTATVYFDEYTTGRNLWTTKPRTMIAKVAEMHALRAACPEEMLGYSEEELEVEKENSDFDRSDIDDDAVPVVHIGDGETTINDELEEIPEKVSETKPKTDLQKKKEIKELVDSIVLAPLEKTKDAYEKYVFNNTGLPLLPRSYDKIITHLETIKNKNIESEHEGNN